MKSMDEHLENCDASADIRGMVKCLAECSKDIAHYLASACITKSGSVNTFGDEQLSVDVLSDRIIFEHLKKSKIVSIASSEEVAQEVDLHGEGFSVAFDPLDGSSIVDCNFSVGSIFGVWPGKGLVGRKGRDQVLAGFTVYGPRTTLTIAMNGCVTEYMLHQNDWVVSCESRIIQEGKIFAPANLRAANELKGYRRLVDYWMENKYTLRYTGGMVPDINHIFVKGKGVFSNPASKESPAKLRLLYEVAPIAFVVEAAGGASTNGTLSALDIEISDCDVRTPVCLGSLGEVRRFEQFMKS